MKLNFDLNNEQRNSLWEHLIAKLEAWYGNTSSFRVAPGLSTEEIIHYINQYPIGIPVDAEKALDFVIEGLQKYAVHTPHPMYYGLYNPRTTFPSILGDTIAATLNPQLAAWSHSPFAAEVENYMIREFGKKFGFPENSIDGTFASGGAEANQTAVLVALSNKFPDYPINGLQHLNVKPVFYASSESHHSFVKAAQTSGIGKDSFKEIPVDKDFRMSAQMLEKQIIKDRSNGLNPFMVVATAGTTGAGIIDPIAEMAGIAEKYGLWFHVDAAYGGAAILYSELKSSLKSIEKANSITFDAHKWLSVPMACSLFLTKHKTVLKKIFGIQTNYMPLDAEGISVTDPYTHSIQWSRRFIGLKLYLSLLVFGWDGYSKVIQHQADMRRNLKSRLTETGWEVLNLTDLPVVCFTDAAYRNDEKFAKFITDKVVKSGKAWISVYKLGQINTLRACITNYNTDEKNIHELVSILNGFREDYKKESIS
jgi:glutamate/tyrosine decarboxylase-like PLP-dependent enzyme